MATLQEQYAAGDEALLAFYQTPPTALIGKTPFARGWDTELAEAMREYQTELGAPKSFAGEEAVVITGQQPAIFTGPLYTIYKAITAITLAREIAEKHGTPCVPIFWNGSEDHDFEEARSTYFLTKKHKPLHVRFEPEGNVDGLPMYQVCANEPSMHEWIDTVAAQLPGKSYREEMLALLHDSLSESSSLANWSVRLIARLFRDTPLLMFSPHLPTARAASRAVLRREIEQPLTTTRLLNGAADELDRLGYPPQVVKSDSECCFFLKVERKRCKVVYEKGIFVLPEDDCQFEQSELLELLDQSPERFSPNVALRCVVQQHLFPTQAYVAGPGELAYWAQLKPVFEHFDYTMPVVYPRSHCALTTIKLNKNMNKLGLNLSMLRQPLTTLQEQVQRNTTQNPAYAQLHGERESIENPLKTLAANLAQHDATASSMLEGIGRELGDKLDRLERTLLNADTSKSDASAKQLERICNSLAPHRKPQERMYTVFSFLFEHGWELIPRLIDELDVHSFQMNEIEL